MREFFKPWRRKIGVVTLGMACVFMAGWVRSQTALELINIPIKGVTSLGVASTDCHIVLSINQFTVKEFYSASPYWIKTDFQAIDSLLSSGPGETIVDLRLRRSGLIVIKTPQAGSLILIAPYWSIVIPLVLLSGYLLLRKPRPPKLPEPAPTTGT